MPPAALGELDQPLFLPLPSRQNRAVLQIHKLNIQSGQLTAAEATSIEDRQHRRVPSTTRRLLSLATLE